MTDTKRNAWDRLRDGSKEEQRDSKPTRDNDKLVSLDSFAINCTAASVFMKSLARQFDDKFSNDEKLSPELKKNIKECFSNVAAAVKVVPSLMGKTSLESLYTSPTEMLMLADVNIKLLWGDIQLVYDMISHSMSVMAKTSKHDAVKHALTIYKNITTPDHVEEELDRVAKEVIRELPGYVADATVSVDDSTAGKAPNLRAALAKLNG